MYSVEGEQHLLATFRHSSLCSTPFHPTPNILDQAGGRNLDAGLRRRYLYLFVSTMAHTIPGGRRLGTSTFTGHYYVVSCRWTPRLVTETTPEPSNNRARFICMSFIVRRYTTSLAMVLLLSAGFRDCTKTIFSTQQFLPKRLSSSKRWQARQLKDHFTREAAVQGLKSRAAFKLLQVLKGPYYLILFYTLIITNWSFVHR